MENLSYEEMQKIEMSATKKLLKYISEGTHDENILNQLEFYYPDFGEDKHRIAFNIWFSLDFTGKDGKTFIERLFEDKSIRLSAKEKSVLEEQSRSNVSLFEITFIDDETITILDLLLNESYEIWEPELVGALSIGDFIFARIGNLLGMPVFIGDISYLPPSMRDMFMENLLYDFNRERQYMPLLDMKTYLKQRSVNIYKIYTDCIYEAMEMDEDIISTVYDELDEFDSFLQLKNNRIAAKRHLSNLMEFFEYYLADEDLTLYDMDRIDFYSFFKEAIKDGFIISPEDINSYISTFKSYLNFLSNKSPEYREKYWELLDISKKRFKYMKRFSQIESPFRIDRGISQLVSDQLNESAISLIMDYDKFLLYILDSPLQVTKKNKFIGKRKLMEINDILTLSSLVEKRSPSQKDFPLIHMFYLFSLQLGLLSIEEDILSLTKNGNNYLRLKDEDKYSLFFQYIWNSDFIKEILSPKKSIIADKLRNNIEGLLQDLKVNTRYDITELLQKLIVQPTFFFDYYQYLQFLGIIEYRLYPSYELMITSLGKGLMDFLGHVEDRKKPASVVELKTYKENSYGAIARKP
ncbi:MAG: hypothetical protein WCZ27_03050 [Tissierellaceae bacterium]